MQLRLVSIDIGQPGVACMLDFQVLDYRGEVIGKGSLRFGDPERTAINPDEFAVGSRWQLIPGASQPAAYANAAPMGPNVGPPVDLRSADSMAAEASPREPEQAQGSIQVIHITADGAGVRAVLGQLHDLLAGVPANAPEAPAST